MDQNEIFINGEGNQWFQRNHDVLLPERDDRIVRMVERLEVHPQKIAEVGCSNGWRLEKLRRIFSADCYGVEASEEAVSFARDNFPQIRVERQDASHILCKESFDLVICNFVLHWLDRTRLLQAVACLKW